MLQAKANQNQAVQTRQSQALDAEIRTKLRSMPFFAKLSDQQLSAWVPHFELSQCEAEKIISGTEGIEATPVEPSRKEPTVAEAQPKVYFLYSGTAQMQAHDHSGKLVGLQMLQAGDLFGDWTHTGSLPGTVIVFAQENCVLLALPKSRFMELLIQSPDCAMAYTQTLTRQLQNMAYLVSVFLSLKANLRVQALLLHIAKHGKDGLCISKMPSHQAMAAMAHTQREVVAKEFSRLYKTGVIEKNASSMKILKPDQLHSEKLYQSGVMSK